MICILARHPLPELRVAGVAHRQGFEQRSHPGGVALCLGGVHLAIGQIARIRVTADGIAEQRPCTRVIALMQTDGAGKAQQHRLRAHALAGLVQGALRAVGVSQLELGHRQAIPDRRFVIELTLRQGMLIKLHRLHGPQLQYPAFFPHQQKRRAVGHQLDWQLGGAVLAGADALASHRVGAQKRQRLVVVHPVHPLHALEKHRHGAGVKTGARQNLHADIVGFAFKLTAESQLVLDGHAGAGIHGGGADLAVFADTGGQNRHQQAGNRQQLVIALLHHRASNMVLNDMGHFVADHRGQFGFALRGVDQPGVHADIAARQGKGVDLRIQHGKELKILPQLGRGAGKPPAQLIEIQLDLRIVQHLAGFADHRHDLAAEFLLGLRRQGGLRGVAKIGQRQRVGLSGQRRAQQRGGEQQTEQGAWFHGDDHTAAR